MGGSLRIARIALALLLFATTMVLGTLRSEAANTLEKLLMPGPVATAHAKIEDNCDACHTPFAKDTQDGLCLQCHKPVKADIDKRKGFHGLSPLAKGVACNLCHDDHKGRDFDMVQLNRTLFDHRMADFTLDGAHASVPCAGCHDSGRRLAEAPLTCSGCHKADEPHKGNLGQECQSCHRVTTWRDVIAFDHGTTRFALKGAHQTVACAACHLGEAYKGIATACNGCHAIQDVHLTRFGTNCQSCHAETAWKPAKFDHDKQSRFPLKGAHATAKCEDCHGSSVLAKIGTACFSCHQAQDVHKAQLGPACGDCHAATAWKADVVFDHGLTRFPLSGLHAVVACEGCHETAAFKDATLTCASCHTGDDVHLGRFTGSCESCHSANGWTRVSFDHSEQTSFALTGKHAKTACYACHTQKNVRDASLPETCFSCHAREDVHRGKFGKNCAQCHDTSSFSTAYIRR